MNLAADFQQREIEKRPPLMDGASRLRIGVILSPLLGDIDASGLPSGEQDPKSDRADQGVVNWDDEGIAVGPGQQGRRNHGRKASAQHDAQLLTDGNATESHASRKQLRIEAALHREHQGMDPSDREHNRENDECGWTHYKQAKKQIEVVSLPNYPRHKHSLAANAI